MKNKTKQTLLKLNAVFMIFLIVMIPIQIDLASAADEAEPCYNHADFDVNKDGVLNTLDSDIVDSCSQGITVCPAGYDCNVNNDKTACDDADYSRIYQALAGQLDFCGESVDAAGLPTVGIIKAGVYTESAPEEKNFGIIPFRETPVFRITVKLDDESEVYSQNVRLNHGDFAGGFYFTYPGCSEEGDGKYLCEFSDIDKKLSENTFIRPGKNDAYIIITDSSENKLYSKKVSFIADDAPPIVEIKSIEDPVSKHGNTYNLSGYDYNITLRAQDIVDAGKRADSPTNANCSGLKSMTLYIDGKKEAPYFPSSDADKELLTKVVGCSFEKSPFLTLGDAEQGTNKLCLEAEDNFGYLNRTYVTVDYDSIPPKYVENSLMVVDKDGKEFSYVGNKMKDVTVQANFEELHEIAKVTADLTSIGGKKDVAGFCGAKQPLLDNQIVCSWKKVDLDLTGRDSVTATFAAEDNFGNKDIVDEVTGEGAQIAEGEQQIDETSGSISKLTSSYMRDSKVFVRGKLNSTDEEATRAAALLGEDSEDASVSAKAMNRATAIEMESADTTIYLKMQDDGSGFSHYANVYLDLSALGLGNSVKADNCSGVGDLTGAEISSDPGEDADSADAEEPQFTEWTCSWENVIPVNTADQEVDVYVTPNSADDTGNPIGVTDPFKLRIDGKKPVIMSEPYYFCSSLINTKHVCKGGDWMDLIMTLQDDNKLEAYADFGEVISAETTSFPGACTEIDASKGLWNCSWKGLHLDSVYDEESVNKTIALTFVDPVNHTTFYPLNVPVLRNLNDTSPEHWTHGTITAVPEKIDRSLAEISAFEIKQYFSIPLEPVGGKSGLHKDDKILRLSLHNQTCYGLNGTEDYIQTDRIRIYNNIGDNPTKPYLSIIYRDRSIDVDKIQLKCRLEIITQHGNAVTSNIEYEDVVLDIDLTGEGVGEASDRIMKEIQDAKSKADKWKKGVVGILLKIYNIYKKVCGIIGTLVKISDTLAKLSAVIDFMYDQANTPILKATLRPIDKAIGMIAHKMEGITKEFKKINNKWCIYLTCNQETSKVNKGTNDMMGKDIGLVGEDQRVKPDDVRNNILLSMRFQCIPGILEGVNKLKDIDCGYAKCLAEQIPKGGTKEVCDAAKEYASCKYVYGSIAGALLTTFVNGLGFMEQVAKVEDWLNDPVGEILELTNERCFKDCTNPDFHCGKCLLPSLLTSANLVGEMIDLLNFDETFDFGDTCDIEGI